MHYHLSKHVVEQAELRDIPIDIITTVLNQPDQIVNDESADEGQKVYQSIIDFGEKGTYLVRVFVNTQRQPNVVKSVYKTSKIRKYYEDKI